MRHVRVRFKAVTSKPYRINKVRICIVVYVDFKIDKRLEKPSI